MADIRWEDEPDLAELRRLYALLGRDPEATVAGLESLAGRGSAASMWYLADMNMRRNYKPKDIGKAVYWYERAAKKGIVQASHILGRISFDQKDYNAALRKFSAASSAGYAPSMYRLASMYRKGDGVDIDHKKCADLLCSATSKGHVFAKRDLATLYLRGAFGWRLFFRGLFMLFLSLPKDLIALKAMAPGLELDERIIC